MSPLIAEAALLIHEFRDPFLLLFHSPPLAHSSFFLPYPSSTPRPTLWYATTLSAILWRPVTALWQAHNKAIQKTAGFFSLYASARHNAVIRVRSPNSIYGGSYLYLRMGCIRARGAVNVSEFRANLTWHFTCFGARNASRGFKRIKRISVTEGRWCPEKRELGETRAKRLSYWHANEFFRSNE